ncbi:MAG: cation:proton antiporter [Anaerotruncus massiliensis (ex Togo et al. 2019)]
MLERVEQVSTAAEIVLSLALMLFAGFFVTRLTKRLRLPNVTGYILAGILIGPWALRLIPVSVIRHMDFVNDVALAFIAFGVGRYFKLSALKKSGAKVIAITLAESLVAAAAVTLTMIFIFRLPVPFSLLLGAIGCATAPASTIMTIRQYHAKGPFVNIILQVVALDDAVSLIAFSVCTVVVQNLNDSRAMDFGLVLRPLFLNLAALAVGVLGGWLLSRLITEGRSQDHRLVLVVAIILGVSGVCTLFDVSPLLSCMACGTAYCNISGSKSSLSSSTPSRRPCCSSSLCSRACGSTCPRWRARASSAWATSSCASRANTRAPSSARRRPNATPPPATISASRSSRRPGYRSASPCSASGCSRPRWAPCSRPSSSPPRCSMR